jgi:hypothetical protein
VGGRDPEQESARRAPFEIYCNSLSAREVGELAKGPEPVEVDEVHELVEDTEPVEGAESANREGGENVPDPEGPFSPGRFHGSKKNRKLMSTIIC